MGHFKRGIIVLALLLVSGCSVKQVSCPVPETQRHLLSERPLCPEGVKPTTNNLCKLDCSIYLDDHRKLVACLNINLINAEEAEAQLIDLVIGLEGKGQEATSGRENQ